MELINNLMAFVERKLFTLNIGHAITAWLGQPGGHQAIREAILDEKVHGGVKGAMAESDAVLITRYGFNADKHAAYINTILKRFENPYLKDDVERVGRQPLRKLSADDRLIKPTLGTLEYHLPNGNLIIGISAESTFAAIPIHRSRNWRNYWQKKVQGSRWQKFLVWMLTAMWWLRSMLTMRRLSAAASQISTGWATECQ